MNVLPMERKGNCWFQSSNEQSGIAFTIRQFCSIEYELFRSSMTVECFFCINYTTDEFFSNCHFYLTFIMYSHCLMSQVNLILQREKSDSLHFLTVSN